jgi:uncharacterized protein
VAHFLNDILDDPGARWMVKIARSGAVVVDSLETAFDSSSRRRGLLGRSELPRGAGLVIAPSNAVYTFFMRFGIDLVFLDRCGSVVKTRSHVRQRRVAACLKGFAVLELPAGTIADTGVVCGDVLTISRREV